MPSHSSIRFVMDGPTPPSTNKKKRARLVTACDACRLRKIKCVQTSISTECEACRASQTSCKYGDREKYHAQRGLSAAQSSQMPSPWNANLPPVTPLRRSSQSNGLPSPPESLSLVYESSSAHSPTLDTPHPPFSPISSNFTPTSAHCERENMPIPDYMSKPDAARLFSPSDPQYPRQDLMEHLAEIFLDRLGAHLPFITRATLMPLVRSRELQPVLANGIAALASRFSDRKEFTCEDRRYSVGDAYLQMAKLQAVQLVSWPALDVLQGLILIAWAEYGSSRDSGLFMFTRMAVAMVLDLGYKDPQAIEKIGNEEEKETLKYTWWSVSRIDLASSWATSKPASLHDPQALDAVPFTTRHQSVLSSRGLILAYLTELFAIRDDITNIMNEDRSRDPKAYFEIVSNIQRRITGFYRNLPSTLAFHADNMRRHSDDGNGALLVLLHLSFHGSNMVVHWPSLFKDFAAPVSHSIDIAYASSIAVVDVIHIAGRIDQFALMTNPFMDVPVSIAARVLMAAPGALGAAVKKNRLFDPLKNEQGLSSCVEVLRDMSRYWAPTATGKALMEQHRLQLAPRASALGLGMTNMQISAPNLGPSLSSNRSIESPGTSSARSLTGSPMTAPLVTPPFSAGAHTPIAPNDPTTTMTDASFFMSPYLSAADCDVFSGFFENSMLNNDWDMWDFLPTEDTQIDFEGMLKEGADSHTQWLGGLHESLSPTSNGMGLDNSWATNYEGTSAAIF